MKRYDSYKHYVLSGHPDTPESYRAYYCAIGRNNADECGLKYTDNMRRWYAWIADCNFHARYTLPIPATL